MIFCSLKVKGCPKSIILVSRNSLDDPVYSRMQRGELEYLEEYSREINSLLRLMVHPDPAARPSAAKLLAHHLLNPTIAKSRYRYRSIQPEVISGSESIPGNT